MTRSTQCRLALAVTMLRFGSFAAYHYLLPRKFKRHYNPLTFAMWKAMGRLIQRHFEESFNRRFDFGVPVSSSYQYRIPIQRA